jgi:hypothetical protein
MGDNLVTLTARLGEDYLRAIGQVTVNFETLSMFLQIVSWRLLGVDDLRGQAITAELSFARVCALAASMGKLRIRDPVKLATLEEALSATASAEQTRNTILHSVWAKVKSSEGAEKIVRMKYTAKRDTGLRTQAEPMTAKDIATKATEINEAGITLAVFAADLGPNDLIPTDQL